jgi:O-antigen/teichoic acid export membrane protein
MAKINKALLSGSLILLVAFGVFNIIGALFHFSMVRMLSITDYGILVVLFQIIYIMTIFSESIQAIITKYTLSAKNNGQLKNIYKRTFLKASFLASLFYLFYLILSIPIAHLLKIPFLLVAFTGLIIFTVFYSPISRGVMQGKQWFNSLGFNMIVEGVFKLSLAILFVFIGWAVYGAILGVILSTVIGFLFSLFQIRNIFWEKESPTNTKGIYTYTTPVFVIVFSILVFFSIDVFIAQIVFDKLTAGYYAIAATLSKIVFFATQPVSKAMFPLSSDKKSKESKNVFANAIGIISIMIFCALILFYFFPDFVIRVFRGSIVPESVAILFYLSIATSLISITNLFLFYKISTNEISGWKFLPLFVLIEILLLFWFSQDLIRFSLAFMTASAMFLWGSFMILGRKK